MRPIRHAPASFRSNVQRRAARARGRRRPALERHAQDLGPAPRRAAARPRRRSPRSRVHTSTVGPAPEIVAPSAPSSRRAADQLGRARVQVRAVGLVEAVVEPAGDQVEVAAREPERRAARRGATLKTASAIGTSARQRRARLRGAHRLVRARRAPPRARSGGRGAPPRRRRRRRSRRAAPRRRCRGGPRARWRARAGRRRARTSSRPPAARRRTRRRSSPARRDSGTSERMRNSKPSAGCRRSNAAHAQVAPVAGDREVGLDARSARSRPPRARRGARARRRARRSPGPRLAEEAGTRTSRRRFIAQPSTARSTAASSGSHGTTAPACASAVCGSLSPWPVSTQTTRSAPSAPWLEQPGDARGRGRLAEDALVRGEEAVGVEDLVVGDRADRAARGASSRPSPPPSARGCRSGSRSRPSRAARPARRARAARRPRPGSRASAARAPASCEALPVGGDVARVADRDAQRVELAELLEDLEGRRSSGPRAGTG